MTPKRRHGFAVESVAARGYEAGGDDYERSRPGYPPAAVDLIVDQLALGPTCTVLELAAGTGKLTRLVHGVHAEVIAVEPVAAMQKHLAVTVPSAAVVSAVAEAIPLREESVDAAIVATAFHWFRGQEALAEIARVLRPGGGLGLLWNNPDRRASWVAEVWRVVDEHRGDVPGNRDLRWRHAFEQANAFTPLEQRRFFHGGEVELEDVIARVASISFIAALPAGRRKQVLQQVRRIASAECAEAERNRLFLPYRTDVYWCRRRNLDRLSQ